MSGSREAIALASKAGSTATATGMVSGNTVEISGGTFSGKATVDGGYGSSESGGNGTATASAIVENNNDMRV